MKNSRSEAQILAQKLSKEQGVPFVESSLENGWAVFPGITGEIVPSEQHGAALKDFVPCDLTNFLDLSDMSGICLSMVLAGAKWLLINGRYEYYTRVTDSGHIVAIRRFGVNRRKAPLAPTTKKER